MKVMGVGVHRRSDRHRPDKNPAGPQKHCRNSFHEYIRTLKMLYGSSCSTCLLPCSMKLMQQCESKEFLVLTFYDKQWKEISATITESSVLLLLVFGSKACGDAI